MEQITNNIPYNEENSYEIDPLYVYESHMGGLYTLDYYADYDDLYCDTCGDADELLGEASNRTEAWTLLEPYTDTFDETLCDNCIHKTNDDTYCYEKCENYLNSGGYVLEYVQEFIQSHWEE